MALSSFPLLPVEKSHMCFQQDSCVRDQTNFLKFYQVLCVPYTNTQYSHSIKYYSTVLMLAAVATLLFLPAAAAASSQTLTRLFGPTSGVLSGVTGVGVGRGGDGAIIAGGFNGLGKRAVCVSSVKMSRSSQTTASHRTIKYSYILIVTSRHASSSHTSRTR